MPFLAQEHVDIPTEDILSWMFDNPKYDLDSPMYLDAANPSRSISARQGRVLVRKLAAGLRSQGLKKGDAVVVASFNDLYYPILALGIIAAGGVFTGANPGYTAFEIGHHVNVVHAKFIICEPECLKSVLDAKHDVPKERVFVFDTLGQEIPKGLKGWKSLLEYGEADWPRMTSKDESSKTTAMLLMSSGTTGLPKAVRLTHLNLIAQHTLVNEHYPRKFPMRRLLALPMFHAAATPGAICSVFRSGIVTYIMRRFDLEPFLKGHEEFNITELTMVPPIAIGIIMHPASKKYSLKTVKWAGCGAAPLDKGPQARLKALLAPDAPFTQVYGMTETSCVASFIPPPEDDATGSVGRFLPNLDVKLVDEEGRDITAAETRGELCLRGPTITPGYFENEEANKRDWDAEGFFHTGDIAYMDKESGKWYIVDRKKELIKVRGFQVAPAELEAMLLSHPSIIDSAVIGVPAPTPANRTTIDSGELPRAYVVQRPGTPALSEKDLVEHCAEKLAKYKRLEGGVKFVDVIPKTASGKILKRTLREWAKKEMGAKL
ncbi:acetyl-CoA synthetase-like protein [Amniculicola lignicola CBS 123094]|uniref:Acetyl-CoA synthetase-like protein n=1 Tax=Amniculicola lignicola CBS 123094 TaxID=1392246 RepID=A0A6A5W772_9PLEO|nr:acetyl-CoA synthetase-like protein [Amniculicola lignicola CBS 123094]